MPSAADNSNQHRDQQNMHRRLGYAACGLIAACAAEPALAKVILPGLVVDVVDDAVAVPVGATARWDGISDSLIGPEMV